MKWIATIFVFTATLALGTFAAALFWDAPWQEVPAVDTADPEATVYVDDGPLSAESLLGKWKGTWGRNDGDCTLLIDRVDGDAFYGTLKKQGSVILFQGTFDPSTRMLRFEETRVVRLGTHTSAWSLGNNIGFLSPDGRTLTGGGHDEWGKYAWSASK